MKGIAHFAVGVAAASCFPGAVEAGAAGNPLYFILGGVFGLLPDTIDFKFSRFFYRHDIEIVPDPNKPDPQMIANAFAMAVNRTHETKQPVTIKLNTIRLGTDLWQKYQVKFDVSGKKVIVNYGPIVDTGRTPLPGTEQIRKKEVSAPLLCGVKLDYLAAATIDVFEGPVFRMEPTDDGKVIPHFIPWHRKWSHSFVTNLICALAGGLIWGPLAGFVILGAYNAHILVDQLGFMGSNLFFPFQTGRIDGIKATRSGETLPNFAAVWLSCLLIFWNLYRTMPWEIHHFNLLKLLFYGAIIPAGLYILLRRRLRTT